MITKEIKDKRAINALFEIDEKTRILSVKFNGTIGFLQWIFDFLCFPFVVKKEPYKSMPEKWLVHWGMFKGYKIVQDEIYTFLNENIDKFDTIMSIGFSKGAATNLFFIEDMNFKYPEKQLVSIYKNKKYSGILKACPKVIDRRGLKIFKKRNIKFANIIYGNDVVTKVPMWFYHPEEIIYEGSERKWYKLSVKDHITSSTFMI